MHMTGMGAFSPPTETPAPKVDGRNARSERTRAKILAATREFMRNGNYRPRMADIAANAGTSVRSIFQHWGEVEALYLDAVRDPNIAAAIFGAFTCCGTDVQVAEAFVTGRLPARAA